MSESGFRSPETSEPVIVKPLNLKPELREPEPEPEPEPEMDACSWRERRCRA